MYKVLVNWSICKFFGNVTWRRSEHATPNYAMLVYWFYSAEGAWEQSRCRKGVCDLLIVPKNKSLFPTRKVPSLYQEKKSILMKENWELMPKWICTNKPKITLAVQWLSHVHLLAIQWTAAHQASLSCISWSLLKLMSIELVMPSNCLIPCHPLLHLPSIFPRWPKYWSFSISPLIFHSFSP